MFLTNIRILTTRKFVFIKLVLSKVPSALKDHCLTPNLLFIIIIIIIIIIMFNHLKIPNNNISVYAAQTKSFPINIEK